MMNHATACGMLAGAMWVGLGDAALGGGGATDGAEVCEGPKGAENVPRGDEGGPWLTATREAEIRALVAEVLSESESRSSLMQNGAAAGRQAGKGFGLWNDDGSFSLFVTGQVQFRYILTNRDEGASDENVAGFELRRTKIIFAGNLFSRDFTYKVNGFFDRASGAFTLGDAFASLKVNDSWVVTWGQFKPPFLREETMNGTSFTAVERSYVNELTTAGRSQGVMAAMDSDDVRVAVSFNDGFTFVPGGPNGKLHNTPWDTDGMEYAVTARAEARLAGDWNQFKDFESWSTDEYGFLVGGAVHFQDQEYGSTAEEVQMLTWTVDAGLETGGCSLFGYIVGVHSDPNADAATEFDQIGFVVQGGVFVVPDEIELFGRYEWFDFDGAIGSEDTLAMVTVGFNRFFEKHAWKWTTDVVLGLDAVPAASPGLGILADAPGQDGQVVVRTQVQFLIQ